MRVTHYILSVIVALAFVSCSGTKGLHPEDKLFKQTNVKYLDQQNIVNSRELRKKIELSKLLPNTPGILNVKTGFYNLFDESVKSGIKYTLKYKMGSKPVIFNADMITITEKRIEKVVKENGYFRAQVTCDSTAHNRRVIIDCDLTTGPRYVIDSVFYIQDTLQIKHTLKDLYSIEYTKAQDYYAIENLTNDRGQFVSTANNNGFPYVNQQDVIFFVDTLVGNNKASVHMRLRPSTDPSKYERFRYGGIYINPNFSLELDNPTDTSNMVRYAEFQMIDGYDFLRENAINKAIFINEGDIYNQKKNKLTTNRFSDFGLFKFVNVKVIQRPNNILDHFINLTTYKTQSISSELELNNRQGNFLGVAGKVTYSNRNIFKGGERFDLSLSGGLETQFGDSQPLINTSTIKLEGGVTFPTVVLPFVKLRTNQNFIPKTFMSIAFNQDTRVQFYTFRGARAKYGFKWNETEYKTSSFTPIDMSWLVLANTTTEFDSILLADPRQALSFQTQLLLGSSYEYVYNRSDKDQPLNQTYFKGTIESAGNLLSLFIDSPTSTAQGKVFGTPYSQFVRLTADVRKYWAMSVGSIATRLLVGSGFAYGNSDELPYSRQYSIGGANSLRAYQLRTLGPGSFQSPAGNANQFIDQTGDIKIESSVEYRFPIFGFFKGALFVDAGNVWLYDTKDSTRQNGVFDFKEFHKQIAVGSGFGLRVDFDFFLIRFDLAWPVRDLQSDGTFDWVINNIDFLDSSWRSNNLVFNLGIGYPF